MVEGLTIMLIVFINLLYTHTMPNNHYCSTYMMAYPHLMTKHCLIVGRNSWFFPDLRHETCQHGAVKVWWRDLQSCWECSSTCYTPIQCQTTTIVAPTWWHTPTWWPNIAWELAENPDFFLIWGKKLVVEVGWRDLQPCWECYWPCYIPNQCQTSIIQQPTCCYTPTWWPNVSIVGLFS